MKKGEGVAGTYRQQLEALNKLSTAILSNVDLEKIERLLVKEIQSIFKGLGCALFVPDGNGYLIPKTDSGIHGEGLKGIRVKIGKGVTGKAWTLRKPIYSNDIQADDDLSEGIHPATLRLKITKLLSVPLLLDGEPVGVLSVGRRGQDPDFAELDGQLLTNLGQQAAIAYKRATVHQALERDQEILRRKNQELLEREEELLQSNLESKLLNDISNIVNSSLDFDEVLSSIMRETCKVLGYQAAAMFFYNSREKTLDMVSSYKGTMPGTRNVKELSFHLDEAFGGQSFKSGEIISFHKAGPKEKSRIHKIFYDLKLKSAAYIPVVAKEKKIGLLALVSRQEVRLDPLLERLASAIGNQVGIAIENASIHRALKREREALQESEGKYRRVFEDSLIGLYRTTPDGRILMANPALLKMLGYSSFDELSRRNLEDSGYEPGYPRSGFKKRIESKGGVIGLESAWIRADGSTLHVRESARAIRDGDGNTLYYEGSVEDITASKLLSEISETVTSSLDLDEVLKSVMRETCKALGFQMAAVYLDNPTERRLELRSTYNTSKATAEKLKEVTFQVQKSLTGQCFKSGKVISYDKLSTGQRQRVHKLFYHQRLKALTCIPVTAKDKKIGVLSLASRKEVKLDPVLEKMASAIGNQVGMAIENASVHQALKKEQEALEKGNRELLEKGKELLQSNLESKLLNDISNIVSSYLDFDKVLNSIMRETCKALSFQGAAIFLYDPRRKTFELSSTYNVREELIEKIHKAASDRLRADPLHIDRSIAGRSFKSGKVISYDKLGAKDRRAIHKNVYDLGIKAFIYIPIAARGKRIGLLVLASEEDKRLDPFLENVASAIGNQVGIAIENASVHQALKKEQEALQKGHRELLKKEEELQQSNTELKLLNEISGIVSSYLNLDKVLRSIMRETCKVLGFQAANMYFYNPERRTLEVGSSYSVPKSSMRKIQETALDIDRSLAGRSFKSGKVISSHKLSPEEKKRVHQLFHVFGIKAFIHIPVTARSETIGVLTLTSRKEVKLDPSQERLASSIGNQVGMAIENARLYDSTYKQATELVDWNKRSSTFLNISKAAVESVDLDSFLARIVKLVVESFKADRCAVALLDETRNFAIVKAFHAKKVRPFPVIGERIELAKFPNLSAVCLQGEIRFLNPETFKEASPSEHEYTTKTKMKSGMFTPLECEKENLGALCLYHAEVNRRYRQEEVDFLVAIGNQVATAIKKHKLAQEVEEKRENLKRLSSEMIQLQEKERKAVAAELHDSVGQSLTAMRINLDFAENSLPPGRKELRSRIRQTSKLVTDTVEEIRSIGQKLRPTMLDDLGLIPTLRSLIKDFSQQLSIPVHFRSQGNTKRLTPDLKITVYRIIQEGLNNIAKHSKATQAWVTLWVKDSVCSLEIKDDGIGIDAQKVLRSTDTRRTFGIFNIRERASLLGGKLEIQSDKGKGTTLSVTIPIPEGEPDEQSQSSISR